MPDIVIVGAGIIGVTLALELRERGASVTVLDRSTPGQEASSAAAGMLAAADPETPAALREFAMESARIYPAFVAKLERLSGLGTDFRRQGSIILSEIGEQQAVPSEYRRLTDAEIAAMEPALKSDGHTAYWMAEDSVDPVLLMKSVLRAAEIAGVEIQPGVEVDEIRASGAQVEVVGKQLGQQLRKASQDSCGLPRRVVRSSGGAQKRPDALSDATTHRVIATRSPRTQCLSRAAKRRTHSGWNNGGRCRV